MTRLKDVSIAIAAVLVLGVVALRVGVDSGYEVQLLMPSAGETFEGAQVTMGGDPIGEVTDLGVKDGQALVTLKIDHEHAPLRAGTTGRITWEAVLGARVVELVPGPTSAPALASGKLITPNVESVSIDQLLAVLDTPTRKNLQVLVKRLSDTLDGKEPELNETLQNSGPTIQALGEVLSAVGNDGPAIRSIVSQLSDVAETVASRDGEVSDSIAQLNTLVAELADRQQQISSTINRLPETIDTATKTLDEVPEPVESTRELLDELEPTTSKLPAIATNLRPVLRDAKQPIADLTPLLTDADTLLQRTPSLLRNANTTLPQLTAAFDELNPMVEFIRPYTPEAASWASNWGSVFASQNSSGNYARALITASSTSLANVPVDLTAVPGGQCAKVAPQPGEYRSMGASYQKCKELQDANGDEIR